VGRPKKEKPEDTEKEISPAVKEAEAQFDDDGMKRIKVTQEQIEKLQAEGKLYGYDPETKIATIIK
jgi:Zn-dependent M16 (insulinase) family peptidase